MRPSRHTVIFGSSLFASGGGFKTPTQTTAPGRYAGPIARRILPGQTRFVIKMNTAHYRASVRGATAPDALRAARHMQVRPSHSIGDPSDAPLITQVDHVHTFMKLRFASPAYIA
jgi:hypothetical protein